MASPSRGQWAAPLAWIGAFGLGLLVACGLGWDEVDHCPEEGCTACGSDDDCVVGSSCCGNRFFCSHVDDSPIVCQKGCRVPDDPPCGCVEGQCRF